MIKKGIMQNLEVWILMDVTQLEGGQNCLQTPYSSLCNMILSAQEQAQTNINIEAFALPGRNEAVIPVVDYWQLKHLPAMVFYNQDTQLSFYALDGNRITERRIQKVLEMVQNYSWSNEAGGYVNANGENVNIIEEMDNKLGGVIRGDWGLPLGGMWGGCKSYLPDSMEKICDIPVWIHLILVILILILLIKIVN
jgi:hypothetical protein